MFDFTNIFKTRPVIKQKKLPIHNSLIEPVVEPLLNQWRHKYIIYILLQLKILYKVF